MDSMHTEPNIEYLRSQLSHVYWLGGSPCSGKSSIADALAAKYGFQLYRCDDAFYRHIKVATPEQQPVLHKIAHLTWEEIWMRPVEQQVEEEFAAYREEFPFILADLLALPESQPVLLEGAALLPECVAPLLSDARRAMWIVPSAEFQLFHYSRREWTKDVVKDCSDPQLAFHNWMERDIRFARRVREEAEKQGFEVIVVDGQKTIAENITCVEEHFRLAG